MNVPINQATFMLKSLLGMFSQAHLVMYDGIMPVSPETALSGNTVLASFQMGFPSWYSMTSGGGFVTASCQFQNDTVTPTAAGTVAFARATFNPFTWAVSTPFLLNAVINVSSNFYVCTCPGTSASTGSGPSGTGQAIVDGTAVWSYIGPNTGQNNVFGDFTVGVSNADIIIANTALVTTIPVTITSLALRTPAV